MENEKYISRLTIRLSHSQINAIENLQNKLLPDYNRSQIIRNILEVINARLEKMPSAIQDNYNE